MNNTIGFQQEVATVLTDDPWVLHEEGACLEGTDFPVVAWSQWQTLLMDNRIDLGSCGVMLDPEEDPALLQPWLDQLPLIALQFPRFMDGRAYSQASLLRTRLGYGGDVRAVGDVLRDQLVLMRHCGFSSFCVRADKPASEAIKGLSGFDQIYARSVASPEPLYRRRERTS